MAQRYETYKDSGVQWLGEIPSHWNTLLNGILFVEDVRKPEANDVPLSLSQVDGVIPTDEMKESSLKTSSYDNWKRVIIDDLVLNRFKAHLGVMFASSYVGMVSFHYGVFKAKMELVPKYYEYLYHTNVYRFIYADASKGMTVGLQNLSNTSFYNVRAIYPPKEEQQSIVAYLDDKCGKIDEWVNKKQKEVEYLQELKQRVIADAVTRGLNPNVTMKQTNNICLGDVPEHWQVMRYGTLFKLKPVKQHHGEELLSVFLNWGVIKAAESDKRTHAASEDLSKYQLVEPTDFVMNNQQAWRGSVGVSKLMGIISPAYHIFIMPTCFDADYANALLRSKAIVGQFEMSSRGVGSIQRTLNFNWLNNRLVPVPPLEEQKQIVAHITDKTSKIDKLISNINKEIEGIKEYKRRLISDVVTGQIKVC
ncbi:MAG: restriction endonuclease subunit S [Paludibacteraceae bacterium]|nr:restriction endonuclease subunit S [Paludibacteraceae bacterium]